MSYPPPPPGQPYGGEPDGQQYGQGQPGQQYGGQYGQQYGEQYGDQYAGYGQPPGTSSTTSGKAITSLILGVVGLLTSFILCGPLLGIPAIIIGFMARGDIKRSQGRTSGTGLAVTGIIAGLLSVVVAVLIGLLLLGLGVSVQELYDEACRDLANDGDPDTNC